MDNSAQEMSESSLLRMLVDAMGAGDRSRTSQLGRQLAVEQPQLLSLFLDRLRREMQAYTREMDDEWLEGDSVELPPGASSELRAIWSALCDAESDWAAELSQFADELEVMPFQLSYVSGVWRLIAPTGEVSPSQSIRFDYAGASFVITPHAGGPALGTRDGPATRSVGIEIHSPGDEIVVDASACVEQAAPSGAETWRISFRLLSKEFDNVWISLGDAQQSNTGWRQLCNGVDCEFIVDPNQLPTQVYLRGKKGYASRTLQVCLPLGRQAVRGNSRVP